MTYLLWRAGRLPAHLPTFAQLSFWLAEGAPPSGHVEVVTHHVHHHGK